MSISAALSNALSGLTASARASEVVSANVVNATTETYGRRELELSSRSLGGGVSIDGVARRIDPQVLADRRSAEASLTAGNERSGFLEKLGRAIGEPGQTGSLTDRIAKFDGALTQAASRPDSTARLDTVFRAAQGVAEKFNDISAEIQKTRADADTEIGREVQRLNRSLNRIADLNERILTARSTGRDAPGLLDERQKVIDAISNAVPVRLLEQGSGTVSLVSKGGAVLVDGSAVTLSFDKTTVFTPAMAPANPPYPADGIDIDGQTVTADAFEGGRLEALFEVRDRTAVDYQNRLDDMAQNLVRRFQDAGAVSVTSSGAGLFTDNGARFTMTGTPPAYDSTGLSARLEVTGAVDPAAGTLWRLRDGLSAASASTSVGNSTRLIEFSDVLKKSPLPAAVTPPSSAPADPFAGRAAEFTSRVGVAREDADAARSFQQARTDSLTTLQLRDGVDTDQEMQKLLEIERAYSANARVVQTADDMLQTLLGI